MLARARAHPYSKPILLTGDRRSRKRKSITWQNDEKILKVHYFEYIADERVNVTRLNNLDSSQVDPNASTAATPSTSASTTGGNSSLVGGGGNNNNNRLSSAAVTSSAVDNNPIRNRANAAQQLNGEIDKVVEYIPWPKLVLIDFTPELPSPGWNSIERSAQAERETYVLGAIDLPGQPSTLDEPDNQSTTTKQSSSDGANNGGAGGLAGNNNNESGAGAKDEASSVKIIPLENPEGMFTEYPDLYSNEQMLNAGGGGGGGGGLPTQPQDNPQPVVQTQASFCNQQSQLLPNQFQQQLATVAQNPFTFREMSAQFHQQQQQQQQHLPQFPYSQQQQQQAPPLSFPQQTAVSPFVNPQQQQQLAVQQQAPMQPIVDSQPNLTGPIMPWLNYPFNQVNENSHTHLFRRPAT